MNNTPPLVHPSQLGHILSDTSHQRSLHHSLCFILSMTLWSMIGWECATGTRSSNKFSCSNEDSKPGSPRASSDISLQPTGWKILHMKILLSYFIRLSVLLMNMKSYHRLFLSAALPNLGGNWDLCVCVCYFVKCMSFLGLYLLDLDVFTHQTAGM